MSFVKFGFFPYSSLYYKGAQEYLDKKAANGLELRQVYLGCVARFEEAEKPLHFVDLESIQEGYDDPMRTYKDYFQLCEDAGWELVQELRGMFLFRSKPGTDPLPIQTDEEMEWERFWERNKPRLRNTIILTIALALLVAMLLALPTSRWRFTPILLSNISLLTLFYYHWDLFFGVLSWAVSKRYLARCKKTDQVETPGRLARVVNSGEVLSDALALILIPLIFVNIFLPPALELRSSPFEENRTATVAACQEHPVVMAQDLGLTDAIARNYGRYLTLRRSLLCEYYDYSELAFDRDEKENSHQLTTERYDCAFEPLARLVFDLRAWETENGDFDWGKLDWEEAPGLGFEESYVCRDGSYLLLRQGKVVALVGCSGVDLTTLENLQIVRTRLELPPA